MKETLAMKRSAIYRIAQIAVVNAPDMSSEIKLAVLKELMEAENLAEYSEKLFKEGREE